MNKEITVILCTYNEAKIIEKTINAIFNINNNVEIIVVDDNSEDETQQIVKNISNPNLKLIARKSRGLASACMVGLLYSNTEIVCWIDANQPDLANEIPKMLNKLNDKNIVVMSRYVPGGSDLRSKQRIFTSKLINFLSQLILDSSVKDYTSGIFLMKKKILQDVMPLCYGHGEYFIEFLYKAKKEGYEIMELPFTQPSDIEGLSKTTSSTLRFIKLGLNYIVRIFLAKLNRK